jgi:hypothetical protein
MLDKDKVRRRRRYEMLVIDNERRAYRNPSPVIYHTLDGPCELSYIMSTAGQCVLR